jgi:DNA-binding SARP family transcriptional activator
VLGPLAVWRDGTPVALGSVRLRAVLGLLALHANVGLHRDTLIDLLWGHRPPASAVPAIQGYISRLRRVLGPGDAAASRAEPVTTVGGCSYRLNTGEGQLQLDLLAFRQLIRQAETAAQPDPARACDRYRRALGLWRGDVLADVDLLREHPAAVEAARQHADATIAYADAALGAGQPGLALPQLRRLCTTEPLNEQAHARLMTVLAAIGQQAAALQSFAALRQRLDSELGIFPSPVLTQAYADVLRQETSPRSRR